MRRITTDSYLFYATSILWLAIATSVGAASPQSTGSTAQAKQHYQNAVAAIDKNDWQTAKSELLQAEKLAPSNALVHYDLALAYSHTGSPESAQAELNKALQLGLPAEQRQAAEKLKEQLSAEAGTAGVQKSGASEGSNASLKSTTDFIRSKLEGASAVGIVDFQIAGCSGGITQTVTYDKFEVDGCSIRLKERVTSGGTVGGAGSGLGCAFGRLVSRERETTVPLQDVSLRSTKAEEPDASTIVSGGTWKSTFYQVDLQFNGPIHFTEDSKAGTTNKWLIVVQDRDMADRLLRAFTHAAKLCGAKQEAF